MIFGEDPATEIEGSGSAMALLRLEPVLNRYYLFLHVTVFLR